MLDSFQTSGSFLSDFQNQKRLLLLLLVVTIGCLGALPLAPHWLSVSLPSKPAQVSAIPKSKYPDGQCTLKDSGVVYKPAVPSIPIPDPLPAVWAKAGRGSSAQAYLYPFALSCAATFIETYETFDYRQPQSFYTALPLLSSAAKTRFYEGAGKNPANIRNNPVWLNQIKQAMMVQSASVSLPTLSTSVYSQGALYLKLDVPYQITTNMSGQTTSHKYAATVLLKGVPLDSSQNGVGWQVADWLENQ